LLARERERKGVKDTDKKKKDEGEEINEKRGGESGTVYRRGDRCPTTTL